jgi:hypothetical protein
MLLATIGAARASAEVGLYGAWWDTADAGQSEGLGVRLGWTFLPQLQLQLGGSYFGSFSRSVGRGTERLEVDLKAIPLDLGLQFDPGPKGGLYFGAGGSAFLLDSSSGKIGDEYGYYGLVGLGLARLFFVEAVYRDVQGTLEVSTADTFPEIATRRPVNLDLGGFALQAGVRF